MRRLFAYLIALGCLLLGAVFVSYYLGPRSYATVAFALVVAASFMWSGTWLVALPAAVPILSFATHTGSIVVEEFDLAALAAFAGAYGRAALSPPAPSPAASGLGRSAIVLVAALAGSYVISTYRGHTGAPVALDLLASDYSPSNNFRQLKGFAWALIALPLLQWEVQRLGESAIRRFSTGMLLGLLAASLVALWERLTFTGLLELAEDYRITASFWEMHVGGGALDGFLALTLPFALWEALQASRAWQRTAAAGLVALAGYVVLVTFSRAVYAASAVALLVIAMGAFSKARNYLKTARLLSPWIGVTFAVAVGCMLIPIFGSGGYRTLAAVCVALGGTVLLGGVAQKSVTPIPALMVSSALLVISIIFAANFFIAKGAYIAFMVAEGVFAISLIMHWRNRHRRVWSICLGIYPATLIAPVLVAYYWNGLPAARYAAMAMLAALGAAAYNRLAKRQLWVLSLPALSTVSVIAAVATVAAVTTSSYLASARFATVEQDLEGRLGHWQQVVRLMPDPGDNWFGAGLGRLPATYVLGGRGVEVPGTFVLLEAEDGRHLRLGLPQSGSGNSEPLRFEQTIVTKVSDGPYEASFEARGDPGAVVSVAICQRHLLYPFECTGGSVALNAEHKGWQRLRVAIAEGAVARFPAYLPRPVVFEIINPIAGRTVDIRNLTLAASDGRSLLRNGDLSAGMAHWFFTSDRIHLPWHAKNLWLGVWFDQGWFGIGTLLALLLLALGRSIKAAAEGVAHAPPAVAALVAFLVVGLFDSLLNVPRLAFLFYLTLFTALVGVRIHPATRVTLISREPLAVKRAKIGETA